MQLIRPGRQSRSQALGWLASHAHGRRPCEGRCPGLPTTSAVPQVPATPRRAQTGCVPVAPKGRSGVCTDVSWDLDLGPGTWLSSSLERHTGGRRDDVPGRSHRPWRREALGGGEEALQWGRGRSREAKLTRVGLAGRATSAGHGVRVPELSASIPGLMTAGGCRPPGGVHRMRALGGSFVIRIPW